LVERPNLSGKVVEMEVDVFEEEARNVPSVNCSFLALIASEKQMAELLESALSVAEMYVFDDGHDVGEDCELSATEIGGVDYEPDGLDEESPEEDPKEESTRPPQSPVSEPQNQSLRLSKTLVRRRERVGKSLAEPPSWVFPVGEAVA